MSVETKTSTAGTITELTDKQRAILALRLKKQHSQDENANANVGILKVERTINENYLSSYSQKRFWFLDSFNTNKATNHVHLATILKGKFNFEAMQKAVDIVIERHEVLRMVYRSIDDEVYCTFHPNPKCVIVAKKLSAFSKKKLDEKISSEVYSEITAPFDLAKQIPIRVSVLKTGRDEHMLIIVMHHIASDLWSLRLLENEIESIYNHYANNQPLQLEPLPVQYLDYALWQRKKLENTSKESEIAYWKEALQGAPHYLQLPTDSPRPQVQTYNGATYKFNFPEELIKNVQQVCANEAITPFVFSLTVFAIMLSRYSGMNDIVIGSPVAGRTDSAVEKLIGLFINTLAIRVKLTDDNSIKQLLQLVKKSVGGAMVHQEYPFEKLVRELDVPQNLSYSPIFQVMFNYQSMQKGRSHFSGMQAEGYYSSNNTTKFDINLAVKHKFGSVIGYLTYNTDLFLPSTIEQMTRHYLNIMQQMTENLSISFNELTLLSPQENDYLVNSLSHTENSIYPNVPYLHKLFEEQAEKTPNAVAVVFEGASYTYSELNERANKLAGYLQALGVKPEKCVGLFLDRSLELAVGILGILKAGGAYVPFDPIYPPERIKYIVEDAAIDVIVTEQKLADTIENNSITMVKLDSDWGKINEQPPQNPNVNLLPNNLIYVLYTSGSTGKPKGVEVEHRNYINYYFGVMQRLKLENGLKYAIASTFAADLATINVWAALNTGGQLHILSHQLSVDPAGYAKYFREHQIDVIKMVPSHFKSLMESTDIKDITPNRCLVLAGEASYWGMIEQIHAAKPKTDVQIHYGPTETTVSMLTYKVTDERQPQHTVTLPLGRPLANVSIYVLDEKLRPVPQGVAGELYIGGAGVARGYKNRPELTSERFITNPFKPNDRLYKSGDSVRFLKDGVIEFLGRVDEQVKVRGFRIELGEINAAMLEFAGIKDAFTVVRDNTDGEKIIVSYYVKQDGQDLLLSELRNYLRNKMPHYMVPNTFVELQQMPLNANGKVNRDALPAPESVEMQSESEYEAPSTQAEQQLAEAWANVLGIKKIGVNDNFFSLGGDSFKAVQVIRGFEGALSIMDIFKYSTIKELAPLLSQSRAGSREVLYQISRGEDKADNTALICVPFAGGSAIAYKDLAEALSDNITLYAVQIPGHDFSQQNEVLQPIEFVAKQCVAEIKQKVLSKKIAVYGHCLGGALAIEIAQLLSEQGFNLVGVFMGGNFPVSELPGKIFKLWNKLFPRDRRISNRAYIDMLRSLGGFAEELSKEERDFIITSLRHDRRESERYFARKFSDTNHKRLNVPMQCVVGELDRTTEFYAEQYHDWEYFCEQVDIKVIPSSGHYFFKHQANTLSQIIDESLGIWQSGEQSNISNANETAEKVKAVKRKQPRRTPAPSLSILFAFIIGQFVSHMGSSLSAFAMGVWVYGKSGAVMDFAATLIFNRLPGILMLPIAGVMADKFDRRKILILSNICSAVVTITLALLFYRQTLQAYHIYIAVAIKSIIGSFQRPSYLAAVAQITPKRYLGQANGIVQLSTSLGEILAPMLGGVLVMVWSLSGIILLDFLTFLFCIATLMLIRFPNTLYHRSDETFMQQMAGGWGFICKRKSFVALVVYFVISNLMLGMANVLVTPLILTFESTVILGIVTSATGLGGLTGGILMGLWGGTKRRSEGMIGFGFLIGLSYIIMGLKPDVRVVVVGVFAYGISMSFVNAHWQTLIQSKVRAELLARVFSINQLFVLPTIPLGYLFGGLLSDKLFKPLFVNYPQVAQTFGWLVGTGKERGIGLLFIAIGICMAVWSLIGFNFKPLRYMDDIIPDAIPDAVFIADRDKLQQIEDRKLQITGKR